MTNEEPPSQPDLLHRAAGVSMQAIYRCNGCGVEAVCTHPIDLICVACRESLAPIKR